MTRVIVTSQDELRALIAEAVRPLSPTVEMEDLRLSIEYLTTRQVADLAGVSTNAVREWANKGWLVPDRTDQAEKYHIDSVRDYLADRLQVAGTHTRRKMLQAQGKTEGVE